MDTGIGATLREAREQQGRSIDDVALALRARTTQLRDLEEERFDTFGGDVYAKGFLKSYALELGLDPAPLLETYRRDVAPDDGQMAMAVSGGMPRPKRQRGTTPPGWIAGVLVVIVVLAVVGFVGALGPGTSPETAGDEDLGLDDPPSAIDADEDDADDAGDDAEDPDGAADDADDAEADDADDADDEADADDDADEDEDETEDPDAIELLLEFEDRSWTRVEVDGTLVLEETVEAGEILPFEGDDEIVVRLGNAGGVRAQLNGEDLGAQGGFGDVLTVVFTPDGAETA